MNDLIHIVNLFETDGEVVSVTPFGSGHINDSYLVTTSPEPATNYMLQHINHNIFRNVPELINNILRITQHLKTTLCSMRSEFGNFQVIQLIQARAGNYFVRDREGCYWRLYNHVRGSRSFDQVKNSGQAYEAGKAFGIFQYLANEFDARALFEVLPNFHNVVTRLATFRETVVLNPAGRVNEVTDEIMFVEARASEMHTIMNLGHSGQIPLRVTHNDTKFNNVLFNNDNKAISVVDLDTVMPGYILFDFGDAIRTGASTGAEDEKDLTQVNIDLGLFEAYATGYLEIARHFLNPVEADHLAFSAKFMTYLIGLRFLTDHIDGDRYYKTGFPGHNLQRARAQFRLLESMEQHFHSMRDIIDKAMKR